MGDTHLPVNWPRAAAPAVWYLCTLTAAGSASLTTQLDQQHLIPAGLGSELVDQGRHKPLKQTRGRRPEQRAQPLGDPRLCLIQRSDHVAPEPGRVVVAGIQA
jgi:hypothetical protein